MLQHTNPPLPTRSVWPVPWLKVWRKSPLCRSCGTVSHHVRATRGVNEYGLVIREMLTLDAAQARF